MIPFVAKIALRTNRHHSFRLWIPLALVWLLLLPVVLLLLPVFAIACLAWRVNPFHALSGFVEILSGLKGTDIEVGHGNASLSIDIF
jgi:hypothetical protein